jgi:hypothetical protein
MAKTAAAEKRELLRSGQYFMNLNKSERTTRAYDKNHNKMEGWREALDFEVRWNQKAVITCLEKERKSKMQDLYEHQEPGDTNITQIYLLCIICMIYMI